MSHHLRLQYNEVAVIVALPLSIAVLHDLQKMTFLVLVRPWAYGFLVSSQPGLKCSEVVPFAFCLLLFIYLICCVTSERILLFLTITITIITPF